MLRAEVVFVHIHLCLDPVHVKGDGVRPCPRAIEDRHDVVPASRFQRIHRRYFQGGVGKFVNNMDGGLPSGEEQVPAAIAVSLVHARKNRAVGSAFNVDERAIAGLARSSEGRRGFCQRFAQGQQGYRPNGPERRSFPPSPHNLFALGSAMERPRCFRQRKIKTGLNAQPRLPRFFCSDASQCSKSGRTSRRRSASDSLVLAMACSRNSHCGISSRRGRTESAPHCHFFRSMLGMVLLRKKAVIE